MLTWLRGTAILGAVSRMQDEPLDWLVNKLEKKPSLRVSGTAVFLTGNPDVAPSALLHNLRHNHVLHERNIVLTFKTAATPRVPNSNRVKIEKLSDTFTSVSLVYGFMETPNVERAVSTSTQLRRPSCSRVECYGRHLARSCRSGRKSSSYGSPARQRMRQLISGSLRTVWSRLARRSWSETSGPSARTRTTHRKAKRATITTFVVEPTNHGWSVRAGTERMGLFVTQRQALEEVKRRRAELTAKGQRSTIIVTGREGGHHR